MGNCVIQPITTILCNSSTHIIIKNDYPAGKIISDYPIKLSIKNNTLIIEDIKSTNYESSYSTLYNNNLNIYTLDRLLQINKIYVNGSGNISVDNHLLTSNIYCYIEGSGIITIEGGVFDVVNVSIIGDGKVFFPDSITKKFTGNIYESGIVSNLLILDEMITSGNGTFNCTYVKSIDNKIKHTSFRNPKN